MIHARSYFLLFYLIGPIFRTVSVHRLWLTDVLTCHVRKSTAVPDNINNSSVLSEPACRLDPFQTFWLVKAGKAQVWKITLTLAPFHEVLPCQSESIHMAHLHGLKHSLMWFIPPCFPALTMDFISPTVTSRLLDSSVCCTCQVRPIQVGWYHVSC